MDLNRRVCDRISVILLLSGIIATATVLPGLDQKTGLNLDCTNDFDELMFCQVEAQNCTEYSLTLRNNKIYGEKNCTLQHCGTGQCCCSFQVTLVFNNTHTAEVWKVGKITDSKVISVTESIKPKTPTIISVNESNGNYEVRWKSNMEGFISKYLTAEVTYYKKGDTQKRSKILKPPTVDGLNYYEINGQHLDPNTIYVVTVKTFTSLSDKFSDNSTEWEFKTAPSHDSPLLAIIISLSIAAVIFSAAIYGTCVKLKTKWWDVDAKLPNPAVFNIYSREPKVFKPEQSITSSVCVESLLPDDSKPWSKMSLTDMSSGSLQESSGISMGSSCLSYTNTEPPAAVNAEPAAAKAVQDALCKLFPDISQISPLTTSPITQLINTQDSGLCSAPYNPCGAPANDTSSGPSAFENKTYSLLIPGCPRQVMTDSLKVQVKAEMPCGSEYHPSKNIMLSCPDQQVPACQVPAQQDGILPPVVSSFMPTDMSYQHCNADSGRFSYAEDSSLSSISGGTNTTDSCDLVSRAESGFESSDEIFSGKTKLSEEVTICVPKGSHSFPVVDDDYQACPSLVRQPDVLLLEQRNVEHKEHLDKWEEESFIKTPQSILSHVVPGFINNVQGGQRLSEVQIPFPSLVSPERSTPVIIDSGYQSV